MARICNDGMGAKTRFHVSIFLSLGTSHDALIRLDLNNPVFQDNLLGLQKPERHAALDTLKKMRQMTWNQLYRDGGLKWEKTSPKPPPGVDSIYSLRMTQARRATAYRDGDFILRCQRLTVGVKSRITIFRISGP